MSYGLYQLVHLEHAEVLFASQLVPLVHTHLLSGLSELHHVSLTSYAFYHQVHLVEAVTRERGVLEVKFGSQRVLLVHANS